MRVLVVLTILSVLSAVAQTTGRACALVPQLPAALVTDPDCPVGRQCVNQQVATAMGFTVSEPSADTRVGACIPCEAGGMNCTTTGIVNEFGSFCVSTAPTVAPCLPRYQCIPAPDPSQLPPANLRTIRTSRNEQVTLDAVCLDCILGMFCPNGTVNRDGQTRTVLCGGGQLCSVPETREACPAGNFCPATVSVALPCNNLGTYCPVNSSGPQLCPQGSFCPDTSQIVTCPEGSYCRELRTAPTKCPPLAICPPGTIGAQSFPTAILFAFISFTTLFIVFSIVLYFYRRSKSLQAEMISKIFKSIELINVILKNLLGSNEDTYEFKGLLKHKNRVSISFDELGLVIGKGPSQRAVLNGVSGTFHHSRIIAVMGPSGSGKSTFLNVLTGKASYGKQTGSVYINGKHTEISHYKKNFGFVPQDDTVHEDMTVRENLMFNAEMRLPKEYSHERRVSIVNDVIKILGLHGVQDSIVGSVEQRGISGGQRKRVNIGIELVSDPDVLFLDEPTSGLDATASLEIIASLTDISRLGMTVIMVIHQPRYSLFALFDDVLLLAPGGLTVYCGPTSQAISYFNAIGFYCPQLENPADYFLDVISGQISHPFRADFQASDLPIWWQQFTGQDKKSHSRVSDIEMTEAQMDHLFENFSKSGVKKTIAIPLLKKEAAEKEKLEIPQFWSEEAVNEFKAAVAVAEEGVIFEDLKNFTSSGGERAIVEVSEKEKLNEFLYGYSSWQAGHLGPSEVANTLHRIGLAPNQVKALRDIFQQFDFDQDGSLDLDELTEMLKRFGKDITKEETRTLLEEAGLADREKISFIDLIKKVYYTQRKRNKRLDKKISDMGPGHCPPPDKRDSLPVALQFVYFMKRDLLKLLRHYQRALFDVGLIIFAGLFVGVLTGSNYQIAELGRIGAFANLTIAILSSVYGLRWFSNERVNYWREMSSGMSRIAFMFSKLVVQLWEVVVHPILFAIIIDGLLVLEGDFGQYILLNILIFWAISGLGMFISVLVAPDKSLLVAALVPVIIGAFLSGSTPSLRNAGPVLRFLINTNFGRWSLEGFLSLQVRALPDSARPIGNLIATNTGLNFDQFDRDLGILFVIGLVLRVLIYPFLRFKNSGKQV